MEIGAAAQIAANVAKLPLSIYQLVKANQLRRQRPEYDIPEEVMQNQNIARNLAMQGLPAEQYNRAASNIDRNAAFGINQANTRRGGLASVAGLNQSMNDAYGNLAAQGAAARRANQGLFMQQNQNVANYQDKAFQLNELEPWQQDMQAAAAYEGAGINNLFNMFNKVGDTVSQYQYLNLWKDMYGGTNAAEQGGQQGFQGMPPVSTQSVLPNYYSQPMGKLEPYYNFGQ